MDGLRWLLLLFGLLVIAGVYFYSRREKATPEPEPLPSERREPTLGAGESPAEPDETDVQDETYLAEVAKDNWPA